MKKNDIKRIVRAGLFLCSSLVAIPTLSAVSTYLSLSESAQLARDVDALVVIADVPQLTRPYSIRTLNIHLEKIQTSHPRLYRRLRSALDTHGKKSALTHASAEIRYHDHDDELLLPNHYGQDIGDELSLSARAHWRARDWLVVNLGTEATENRAQATGSIISLGADWAQLDLGYKERWHSPFKGSAQLLSTNARTMASLSVSNVRPISFWGKRMHYEIAMAQMSKQPTLFEEVFSDERPPLLSSFHVMMEPLPGWSIGVSRMLQFAGGERPTDFELMIQALIDPQKNDNDASADEESGNQVAALTNRINFPGEVPFSVSLEVATEDVGNANFYVPGNTALTAGVYFPFFFSPHLALAYEYSDWQVDWYVNNVYQQGYSHHNAILGHWAFQVQHDAGTSNAGKSQFLQMSWDINSKQNLTAELRTSEHEDTGLIDYQMGWSLDLQYRHSFERFDLSAGIFGGKDNFDEDFWQLRLGWQRR